MALILRNGKSYSSGDVKIALFGSLDYEVTAISYSTSQTHTPNYSLGSDDPTSYSMGKKERKGSITMRLPSVSAIEKAVRGDLLKIKPFPINVTYLSDENLLINDTIIAKFMDQGRDVGGDDDLKQTFELFVLDIKFNNVSI